MGRPRKGYQFGGSGLRIFSGGDGNWVLGIRYWDMPGKVGKRWFWDRMNKICRMKEAASPPKNPSNLVHPV